VCPELPEVSQGLRRAARAQASLKAKRQQEQQGPRTSLSRPSAVLPAPGPRGPAEVEARASPSGGVPAAPWGPWEGPSPLLPWALRQPPPPLPSLAGCATRLTLGSGSLDGQGRGAALLEVGGLPGAHPAAPLRESGGVTRISQSS